MTQIKYKNYKKLTTLRQLKSSFSFPWDETDSSVPLLGTETKEFSPIFRNKFIVDNQEELAGYLQPTLSTFYQIFEESIKENKDKKSIGYRKPIKDGNFEEFYTWESYEQLAKKRTWAGSAFLYLVEKYAPDVEGNDFILTLFSANKPEWIISDLASHAYSIPNTPLYDTLGQESTNYILKLTKSPIIVLSKSKISKILSIESSYLKIIVSIEDLTLEDDEIIKTTQSKGYYILDFKNLLELGKLNPKKHIPPKPETLYTITFTSGTTGIPKGVELTHKNISAAIVFLFTHVKLPKSPTSLVFLPLAHVYERFKIVYELAEGGAIGFPHNPEDTKTFLTDIKILKPSHISSVPRLYNRIESGLKDKIKNTPGFKGWLLRFAVDYKLKNENGILTNLLNSLIIIKIRQQLGFENLDFLITGGSSLSSESIVYLRKILNCGFYQGYGSSEAFGGISITTPYAEFPETTGAIGVSAEFKLRNLPDLNYTYSKNKSGELLLRGPQIFQKYFKNEEATKSSIDEEGWFSTGDIVSLNEKNQIAIVDRVKNFFKLSQGEYIAAEKIENLYLSNNSFISQLFVYGDSFQSYLVAIVGIELEKVLKLIQNSPLKSKISTHEQLLLNLDDLQIRKFLLEKLNFSIKNTGLFGFEKLKNIIIRIEPFKTIDDTITPTLKLKRNKAQAHFQKEFDEMYAHGPL